MPWDFADVENIVYAVLDILLTNTWSEKSMRNLFKVLFEVGLTLIIAKLIFDGSVS